MRGTFLGKTAILVQVDLRSPTFPGVRVTFPHARPGKAQYIAIESRPTKFGGWRWFFTDYRTGEGAEILYLINSAFRFRKAARLTYKSQGVSETQRFIWKCDRLERRLKATSTRGPARGKVREAATAELGEIGDLFDMMAAAMGRRLARRAAKD